MNKILFKEQIEPYICMNIRRLLTNLDEKVIESLTEIRININSPLYVEFMTKRFFVGENGLINYPDEAYIIKKEDLNKCLELITNSSVYAYNRNMIEGFITLPYGHRVGIVGNCVVSDNKITAVKDVNSLNYRISHFIKGASDIVFDEIFENNKVNNTLIISPPGCGKTTLLKDIICSLNNVKKTKRIINCAVVDERFELSSLPMDYKNNVIYWTSTSVVYGCPKSLAVSMVVRSMCPDVIIVDELSCGDEIEIARYATLSGCSFVASVHGTSEFESEINYNDARNIFKRIIILSNEHGPGTLSKIVRV